MFHYRIGNHVKYVEDPYHRVSKLINRNFEYRFKYFNKIKVADSPTLRRNGLRVTKLGCIHNFSVTFKFYR